MKITGEGSKYQSSINDILKQSVEKNGSDVHLVAGRAPSVRINGEITTLEFESLIPSDIEKLLLEVVTKEQISALESELELDFSYAIPQYARFRGNVIYQRGTLAMVFRIVPFEVPNLDNLDLPSDISRLCTLTRGLVLVTGPTGSGKSTTLAAIIDKINKTKQCNILTIEDPIEFLHSHQNSMVRQREVGSDTKSFAKALKQALRHDPDIILIGEMRDPESIAIALTAAETGHLVLSTLHTQTAPLSISRIVDSFPAESKEQIRQQLAGSLRAVISQQLVPTNNGKRIAAVEYMVDTPAIKSMIREGKEHQLYNAIQTGKDQGMRTMDQSLSWLYQSGKISYESVMQYCVDKKEALRLINNIF